jgi:hypothetical protein
MFPLLGGEVLRGQERRSILRQARRRLVVLRAVFVDEAVEGGLRLDAVWGFVDGVEVLLGLALDGLRQGARDVGGLVDLTSLLACRRPDLVQRLPEGERAVADGELGGDGETVLVTQT